jgi:hypothetical protein
LKIDRDTKIQMLLVLVAYLAFIEGVGLFASRKTKNEKEFVLGRRNMPGWATALSERVTSESAGWIGIHGGLDSNRHGRSDFCQRIDLFCYADDRSCSNILEFWEMRRTGINSAGLNLYCFASFAPSSDQLMYKIAQG